MASWFLLVASAAVNKHYQLSPYIAARLFLACTQCYWALFVFVKLSVKETFLLAAKQQLLG